MREIKVRGYSVEKLCADSQWVEGFGVLKSELTNGNTDYILFTPHGNYEVHGDSVGQYTGFDDKYGNDIYEGDIVHSLIPYYTGVGSIIDYDDRYYKVIWKNSGFCLESKHGLFADFDELIEPSVVGNIYENPDLINA